MSIDFQDLPREVTLKVGSQELYEHIVQVGHSFCHMVGCSCYVVLCTLDGRWTWFGPPNVQNALENGLSCVDQRWQNKEFVATFDNKE